LISEKKKEEKKRGEKKRKRKKEGVFTDLSCINAHGTRCAGTI